METIRDGSGGGHLAGVTEENMLMTRAMVIPHTFHHAKFHADSFVTSLEHKIQAADTQEVVAYLEYTGSASLVISRVSFNSSSAGGTHFYIRGGATGLSTGTAGYLYNTNSGSQKQIDVNIHWTNEGATPITYTTLGANMWEVHMGFQTQMYIDVQTNDSFIIRPGTYITFTAKSAAVDDEVGINLHVFEERD